MRLIDADALMETIRAQDYPLRSYFNSTDRGMFTVGIQQAVDEQPTVTASTWHRVEDGLPETEYSSTMTTQDNREEWGIVKKMRFYRKAVKWLWKHRAEDNNRHKWRRMMREVQE